MELPPPQPIATIKNKTLNTPSPESRSLRPRRSISNPIGNPNKPHKTVIPTGLLDELTAALVLHTINTWYVPVGVLELVLIVSAPGL